MILQFTKTDMDVRSDTFHYLYVSPDKLHLQHIHTVQVVQLMDK